MRWGSRPFLSNDSLCFSCIHSFIYPCTHSFIASQCESAQLGLTPPTLSRLGGALWERLLPPSLPSPLPFPGRGTRDLKGLSTEVPPPFPTRLEGSHHGMVELSFLLTTPPIHHPVSFTVFGCCFQFYQRVLPACMHHSASASVQLSETTSCQHAALNRCCCCGCWHHHRWWWWWRQRRWRCCVVLQNALWTMKDETPRCSLAVALTSKPHLSHQDFFASTNRIGCSVRSDITEASLCVFFSSSSASSSPAAKWPPNDADFGNAISSEMHGSDSRFCVTCTPVVGRTALDCNWLVFQQGCSLEGQSAVLENDYDATPDHSELEEAWWEKAKLGVGSCVFMTPRIAQNLSSVYRNKNNCDENISNSKIQIQFFRHIH